jgi:hypothetical protein
MKFRVLFGLSALAAVALSPIASAADLAIKALPLKAVSALTGAPCDVTGCSGFYAGAQISGSGTGVNIINLGSLNAGGTFMGVNAGYQFYNGVYWLGVGAKVEYDVGSTGTSLVGNAFSNKIFAFEGVEFGGAIATMLGIAPLNLPGWLSTAIPTVKVGACQHGSELNGYCAGAAAHFFIPASRWTIDAEYLNAQYGTTTVSAGVTANTENRGSLGFSYHF